MAPNPSKTTKANARKAPRPAISGLGAALKEEARSPKIIQSKSNLALLKAREAFNAAGVDIAPWPVPKQD